MPRRYIIALIVVAVVFFAGIWLLISIVTRDRTTTPETEPVETAERAKELSIDTNSVVYTLYGPVVGEEARRAIRITVTENERRAEVLEGYNETVGKSQTTENNKAAFDSLLIALDGAGFDQINTKNTVDERSVCTTGRRYVFEAKYSGDEGIKSWATSCSRQQGSFQGNRNLVQTLMERQIPEFSKFESGVEL